MQSAKAGGVAGEERALNDIATEVIAGMQPGALYILGPGTTTRTVMERLGLPKTLLGVDAVRDGELAGADLTEADLLALVDAAPEAHIVVTVIGGQGHIFGRGNQQISPAVIRRVGAGHIIVIATQTKLLSLEGRPLLVDTGDPALDEELSGYAKVDHRASASAPCTGSAPDPRSPHARPISRAALGPRLRAARPLSFTSARPIRLRKPRR